MEHIWSIICSNSVIDQETNNLSLFNVIEQITIQLNNNVEMNGAVMIPVPFEVISFFYLHKTCKESCLITAKVFDPQDKIIGEFENHIQISEGIDKARSRIRFNGIPFISEGIYRFRIYTNVKKEKLVAEIPLMVKVGTNS